MNHSMNKIWVKEAMALKVLILIYPKDSHGFEKINVQYG
jgi:hypothetical protein